MLDDYIETQSIAYKIIKNQVINDLVSHAYIIESNKSNVGMSFAKSFAKTLLCPNKYTNLNNCDKCTQCKNLDENNFIEFKIIEPNGNWITKEQIEDLQNTFMKKPIVGTKKVYIINHFDKMRQNLMDKMLKFIEEPLDGIIAILVTDNKNKIIETILSRCQLISLKTISEPASDNIIENIKNNIDFSKYKNIEINEEKIDKIINFISYYEKNKKKTLLFTKELWHDNFNNQEENDFCLNVILLFYKEILNYKIDNKIEIFKKYENILKDINKNNDINQISDKIVVIIEIINKIKYNVNQNLIIDKLIIELEKR